MPSIHEKCNELIRIAADISSMNLANSGSSPISLSSSVSNSMNISSLNLSSIGGGGGTSHSDKINISIDPADNTKSLYYKKIPIELDGNYDCGELFIKVMGDEDQKGKFKWYSIIEMEMNHFNLRGEIKCPFNIIDVRWKSNGLFVFKIKYDDVEWTGEAPVKTLVESSSGELDDDLINMVNMAHGNSSDSDYKGEASDDEDEEDEDEGDESGDDSDEDGSDDESGDEEEDELNDIIIKKEGIHVSIA